MRFFNSANHQTPTLIKHLFSLGELTQEAINELDKIKKKMVKNIITYNLIYRKR